MKQWLLPHKENESDKMKKNKKEIILLVMGVLLLLVLNFVLALPTSSTITFLGNSTRGDTNGTIVNGTGTDTANPYKAGGFIFTMELNGVTQNSRWKGYVGNVTGTLTLDDADSYTIYDWEITASLSGEVYATRTSLAVNWTNINCSFANATHWEEIALNHTTNPNDNISATFNDTDNSEFYVGDVLIAANTCNTINLFVNDSSDINDDFEEILLYDGQPFINVSSESSNPDFTNIVYAAILENDAFGYRGGSTNDTYDFQMILPEVATTGWASSTAYYFFVELT